MAIMPSQRASLTRSVNRFAPQGLIDRFAPQQRTDYVSLLNEWAVSRPLPAPDRTHRGLELPISCMALMFFQVGFYTELDFQNEGKSQVSISEQRTAASPSVTMPWTSHAGA